MNGLTMSIDWNDYDRKGRQVVSIKIQDFYGDITYTGDPDEDRRQINELVMGELAEYLAEDIAHFTGLCECGWYEYEPKRPGSEDDD